MKFLKCLFQCPLLFILVSAWLGISAYTISDRGVACALTKENLQNPVFVALMEEDEKEMEVPDSVLEDLEKQVDDEKTMALLKSRAAQSKTRSSEASDKERREEKEEDDHRMESALDPSERVEIGTTEFATYKPAKVESPYYSDGGKRALTTTYPYETVGDGYFKDALFLGDSRTVGLQDYSGLTTPTYLAKTGLSVYQLLDDPFVTEPNTGEAVDVTYMLQHYSYKKIYIMVGINELGTGNTGTFQKAYASVLSKILEWQPEALVYIQGIIAVSAKKNAEDPVINNTNINDKNAAIAQLADGHRIFYLDLNPVLTDKRGNLRAGYTFDDVHMYAQYYSLWSDFLKKHAVKMK